jgi:hypothetical protein
MKVEDVLRLYQYMAIEEHFIQIYQLLEHSKS